MQSYEEWVLQGRPDGGPRHDPPLFCATGEELWPEDVPYAMAQSFAYVARALDLVPWSDAVHSLVSRVLMLDPTGAAALRELVGRGLPRFQTQLRHAMNAASDAHEAIEPEVRLRRALHAYSSMYEIDLSLWLLGVLAKAVAKGRINLNLFGGPSGSTAQGAMINDVAPLLVGTPLDLVFSMTYDARLRNVADHNDFDILERDGELHVDCTTTDETWEGGVVFQRLMMATYMAQAVQLAIDLNLTSRANPNSDAGILTVTCDVTGRGAPLMVLGQLDCFHRLDPAGAWVDSSNATFVVDDDVGRRMMLTERAAMPLGSRLTPEFRRAIADHGWIEVHRVAIAPNTGQGLRAINTMSGESYEVVRPPDRHYIGARLVESGEMDGD